jgi:uncharacterized protein
VTRRPSGDLVYPVAGLLADPPGSSRRLAVGPVAVEAGPDIVLATPVAGDLVLARTNRGLLVRAALRTAIATECSRCLRPIEVALELAIDEEALPSIDLTTGAPVDTSDEPEAVRLTQSHELDLEPLVRDAIQLSEPIAPLHAPGCAGLCSVCGADLNEPGHAEHAVELDPRLEVLRAFRVDEERETD